MENDPRHLLINVAEVLRKLEIPYVVTGGMAVLVWGRPRFTADIDIVIKLEMKDIKKLAGMLSLLGKFNYINEEMMKEALENKGEFNFIHGDTGVKVDFWVSKERPLDLSQMNRRVYKSILNKKVGFMSPEDLILSKLEWYKESRSSRHLEDIESIFRISGDKLDKKYLNQWVNKLGLSRFLDKVKK